MKYFLGIAKDSNLKLKAHTDNTKTKLSIFTGIIYKIRDNWNEENIILFYSSLIYPSLILFNHLGLSMPNLYSKSIYCTRILLFIMFKCHTYEHINPYFSHRKILKVHDMMHLQTCLYVYNSQITNSIDRKFETCPHGLY